MLLRFGTFELDRDSGELRRAGRKVALAPQPFAMLEFLAMRPGSLVTREELQSHLWGAETYVESDLGLNSCVRKIRLALGDDAQAPRFVETLPKRGYRFVAPVTRMPTPSTTAEERGASRPHDKPPVSWPRYATGLVIVTAVLAAILWSARGSTVGTPGSGPKMIAILPFEDLRIGGDSSDFAVGLREELVLRLARRLPADMGILGNPSTPRSQDESRESNASTADLWLSGTLRGADSKLRLNVQLIRASDRRTLWAEAFDAGAGEELELQETIAGAVAAAASAEFKAHRLTRLPASTRVGMETTVPEASEAYLKGLYLLERGSIDDLERSAELFGSAIEHDPALSGAHAGLARARAGQVFAGALTPDIGFPQARVAANRALELDPHDVDARIALGYERIYFGHDFEVAGDLLSEATELAPGLARTHCALAVLRSVTGESDRAVEQARLARDLDPLNMSVRADLCWYLLFADEFEGARIECVRALELEPENQWTLLGLSEALLALGDEPGAMDALSRAFRTEVSAPSVSEFWGQASAALAGSGRDPYLAAVAHARAGHLDEAVEALEAAHEQNSYWMVYLLVDPRLDPLRGHPGFETLVGSVGLRT